MAKLLMILIYYIPISVDCQHAESADSVIFFFFIIAQCVIVCITPAKEHSGEKHKLISENQKALD
jgi:hypothetical protein